MVDIHSETTLDKDPGIWKNWVRSFGLLREVQYDIFPAARFWIVLGETECFVARVRSGPWYGMSGPAWNVTMSGGTAVCFFVCFLNLG